MATSWQVSKIVAYGERIILDTHYTYPSDIEVKYQVGKFIQYRNLLVELKKELCRGNSTDASVLTKVSENLHVIKDFDYAPDSHDCDNAAFEMLAWVSGMGWAFGVAILDGHAMCCFINDREQFKFVDSYTGEVMDADRKLKILVMP